MGENDWFSVVKLKSTWGGDVSLSRVTYFIWNAYQEDTNNTDAFYRNNYFTINEINEGAKAFYNAVKNNKNLIEDEGLKQSNATFEMTHIYDFFEEFDEKCRSLFKLAVKEKSTSASGIPSIFDIDVDISTKKFVNMHTKEEFREYIVKNKIKSVGLFEKIKHEIRKATNVLSKRHPQMKDADVVISFYTDIYLLALKKWLIKENQ